MEEEATTTAVPAKRKPKAMTPEQRVEHNAYHRAWKKARKLQDPEAARARNQKSNQKAQQKRIVAGLSWSRIPTEEQKARYKARRRKYYEVHRLEYVLPSYRSSAMSRGIPFYLTKEELEWFVLLPCHYCGIEPAPCNGVDRIDNDGPYDIGNIVECCRPCNFKKGRQSYDVFVAKMKSNGTWQQHAKKRVDDQEDDDKTE